MKTWIGPLATPLAVALSAGLAALATLAAALPMPAAAQAPAAAGLRVNLFVDERRNKEARTNIGDGVYPAYVYRQERAADGSLRVQPADALLMGLWKGDATLTPKSEFMWETPNQFAPVLLVLEVSNDGTAPLEIGRAYLRVRDSQTDRQPLIRMGDPDKCGGMESIVQLWNDGWRSAERTQLRFRFGGAAARTPEFQAELGQIGHVAFHPLRALASLMPALPELLQRPPKCASVERVPACFAALERSGRLGRLAGVLKAPKESATVTVPVDAVLSYQWTHHPSGEVRARQQRLETAIKVFEFDVGGGPECGAAGPGESGYRAIPLQLDTSNYQVPLPYRGPVGVRGNRRFELTLNADRASQHRFEVVVETTDGRSAVSPPVDLVYFVPTKNRSPLRDVE